MPLPSNRLVRFHFSFCHLIKYFSILVFFGILYFWYFTFFLWLFWVFLIIELKLVIKNNLQWGQIYFSICWGFSCVCWFCWIHHTLLCGLNALQNPSPSWPKKGQQNIIILSDNYNNYTLITIVFSKFIVRGL